MHLSRVRNDHAADKWGNCLDYGVGIACCETAPGEQMQVDWAVIRRGSNRLSVFVATLGWSRASYVEFVTDERVWSGMAMVGVDTASIQASSTLLAIVVSNHGCVRPIERRT